MIVKKKGFLVILLLQKLDPGAVQLVVQLPYRVAHLLYRVAQLPYRVVYLLSRIVQLTSRVVCVPLAWQSESWEGW